MKLKLIKNHFGSSSELCIGNDTSGDVIGDGIFISCIDGNSAVENLGLALQLMFGADFILNFQELFSPFIEGVLIDKSDIVFYTNASTKLYELAGVKTQEEFNTQFQKRANALLDNNPFDIKRTGVFSVGD